MGRGSLGKRKELEETDPRAAQAGSPIALLLFDLLADPSSTLRGLLRVSDLFCVRLTCKEAWRCIQHQPLSRRGVVKAATDQRGFDHHVPLLRWCLRNGIVGAFERTWRLQSVDAIGEAGDAAFVSELLEIETKTARKTERVMIDLLRGVARAGYDELALQLLADLVERAVDASRYVGIKECVAFGGCIRTAAAIDDDPTKWVGLLTYPLRNGQQRFVEWVLCDVEPDDGDPYIVFAACSGSLELVMWLYGKGYAVGGRALTSAAASGNVDLCKWVSDHGLVPNERTMVEAVTRDHVEVLEWLSTKGCRCTSYLLRLAVRSSGVPVVSWCLDHLPQPADSSDLLVASCRNTRSDVFEYLVDERGFQSSPTELMQAVARCHSMENEYPFDAAILAKRYGTPLYPGYMMSAIYHENVGRLRFALSQGQEVTGNCYYSLVVKADATLLNEVLLARKVGGSIPEVDRELIKRALHDSFLRQSTKKVLMDHF